MANNPIPADQSRWGTFDAARRSQSRHPARHFGKSLGRRSETLGGGAKDRRLLCLLHGRSQPSTSWGSKPLEPELKRIDAIQSKDQIVDELVRLHPLGVGVLFSFSSSPDAKNSTQMIADADQGGLGLPDRDYYLKDRSQVGQAARAIRGARAKDAGAGGRTAPPRPPPDAQAVLRIETDLAKGSLDRVARRDPNQTYHKMSVKELAALAPSHRLAEILRRTSARLPSPISTSPSRIFSRP